MIEVKCISEPLDFIAPTFKEAIKMAKGVLGKDATIEYLFGKRIYGMYLLRVVTK